MKIDPNSCNRVGLVIATAVISVSLTFGGIALFGSKMDGKPAPQHGEAPGHEGHDHDEDHGHAHPHGRLHLFRSAEKGAVSQKLGQKNIVDEDAADDEDNIVAHGNLLSVAHHVHEAQHDAEADKGPGGLDHEPERLKSRKIIGDIENGAFKKRRSPNGQCSCA